MEVDDIEIDPALGRYAERPWSIPRAGWWQIIKRTMVRIARNRIMLISAGVTLYLLLALVPAMSIVVSIYGLFSEPVMIAEQVSLLAGMVPAEGLDIIRTQLTRIAAQSSDKLGVAVIVALGAALWGPAWVQRD